MRKHRTAARGTRARNTKISCFRGVDQPKGKGHGGSGVIGYRRIRSGRTPRGSNKDVNARVRGSIDTFLRDIRARGSALTYVPDPQRKRHYLGPLSVPTHISSIALHEGFLGFSSRWCTRLAFLAYMHRIIKTEAVTEVEHIKGMKLSAYVIRDEYGECLYRATVTMYPVDNFY